MPDDLMALAEALETATTKGKLRFSLFAGEGWVTTASEPTIRALCSVWSNRKEVAQAIRARASQSGVA